MLIGVPLQVKGKGLLTRLVFGLAFRWKQLRIHMGAAVESVSPLQHRLITLLSHLKQATDLAGRRLLLLPPDQANHHAVCVAHRQSRQGEQLCRVLCMQT
jgi:hypothetical protein